MEIKFKNRFEIAPGLFSRENEVVDMHKDQAIELIRLGVAIAIEEKQDKKVNIKNKKG